MRKIIFIALAFCLLVSLTTKTVQAFDTPGNAYQLLFENAVFNTQEMNLQSFVYENVKAMASTGVNAVAGCLSCPADQRKSGLLSIATYFIASIYGNPPASGVEYLADLGKRINLVSPAYAQGAGYIEMQQFQKIWRTFRNIAYVFFAIILVFMGFAIMFRVKLSPQTVITIQSALPRIVLGLILITFSYAIVGLMIDLAFVLNNLIVFTFKNLWDPGWQRDWVFPADNFVFYPNNSAWFVWFLLKAGVAIWMPIFLILQAITAVATVWWTGGIGNLIVLLLIAIIAIIAFFRVLWVLLKAYINVVFSLIFAPFQILIGVLPGSNGISSWFKNLISNLAVLPVILTIVCLALYFESLAIDKLSIFGLINNYMAGGDLSAFIQGAAPNVKALQDNTREGGIFAVILYMIAGLATLLIAPKTVDLVKAFMSGQPFAYGTAIGEAIGPARGLASGYLEREAAFREARYKAILAPTSAESAQYATAAAFLSGLRRILGK